jgi:hypothetical protein
VPRIIAVDWSGAKQGAARSIWLAEARDGEVVRLEGGRDRGELVRHLVAAAGRDADLVVGLDFAFSLPSWFLRLRGINHATGAWELVAREGERWLAAPEPPFWRTRKPALPRGGLRTTELEVRRDRGRPKSVFQLVGHGQVGTGSLRGMPYLRTLREHFAIWPFDEPRLPLVVEIYPRIFVSALADEGEVAENEHARDAFVSALAMAAWTGDWTRLPRDSRYELEGRIWEPGIVARPR